MTALTALPTCSRSAPMFTSCICSRGSMRLASASASTESALRMVLVRCTVLSPSWRMMSVMVRMPFNLPRSSNTGRW